MRLSRDEYIGAGAGAAGRTDKPDHHGVDQQRLNDTRHAQRASSDLAASMIPDTTDRSLSPAHQKALQRAFVMLERQNFAARLADYAGQPMDRVLRTMPKQASAGDAWSWRSARSSRPRGDRRRRHLSSLLAGINGGISGFFGLAALPIELPVTTTLMLRAIADTARPSGRRSVAAGSATRLRRGLRARRRRFRKPNGYRPLFVARAPEQTCRRRVGLSYRTRRRARLGAGRQRLADRDRVPVRGDRLRAVRRERVAGSRRRWGEPPSTLFS
jgi:hypothetical protein